MAAGKRKPGESFEDYRARLKREEKIVSKGIAVGRVFWSKGRGSPKKLNGKNYRTYVKPKPSVMELSHGL